jgi:hypothetical protein
MSHPLTAARALALVVPLLVAAGCASMRYDRLEAPSGTRALGLDFGADRAATEKALRAAGIEVRSAPLDADALLADRCPGAPVRGTCRLLFGPQGLYAAELEAPATETDHLADAVQKGLGRPDRVGEPGAGAGPDAGPALVAGWDRPGWTITVSRGGSGGSRAVALCRVEYDALSPPVVAGVPLGRLREDVEHALDVQGATLLHRDGPTTSYLGCPQGEGEALSCVVTFQGGRAAAVTEVLPAGADEASAMASWRSLARKLEREIGRAPEIFCPANGPDRVAGDCTATWASDRLVVVVGAHRSLGSRHRGQISVYTSFSYPPLAAKGGAEDVEAQVEAR